MARIGLDDHGTWFDDAKATVIGRIARGDWHTEVLYLTATSRRWIYAYLSCVQGERDIYNLLTADKAAEWCGRNGIECAELAPLIAALEV